MVPACCAALRSTFNEAHRFFNNNLSFEDCTLADVLYRCQPDCMQPRFFLIITLFRLSAMHFRGLPVILPIRKNIQLIVKSRRDLKIKLNQPWCRLAYQSYAIEGQLTAPQEISFSVEGLR